MMSGAVIASRFIQRSSSIVRGGGRYLSTVRNVCELPSSKGTAPHSYYNPYFSAVHRMFSSTAGGTSAVSDAADSQNIISGTDPNIFDTEDGRRFAAILQTPPEQRNKKLKPSIVRKRLEKMRTYEGKEKHIRHSPWRLNLVCQFVAGMTVPEALTQLEFLNKRMAPVVQKVIRRTANLAEIRDGLQASQLEIAECFATQGRHLKRIKIMGRGRHGVMHHKHSHIRLVIREIDFKLRIYQAKSLSLKKRWIQRQIEAESESQRAAAERLEIERLEAKQKETKLKMKEKENDKQ